MNGCIEIDNVKDVGESFLADFDRRYKDMPFDLCAAFNLEASRVETQLETFYGLIAKSARATEDLKTVGKMWGVMADLCEGAEERLEKLLSDHPGCNAEPYKDSISHMKNKCLRLQKMHS